VFRSTDNGAHWEKLPGFPYEAFSIATDSRGGVIVGTLNDGVFSTTDDGERWTVVKKAPGCDGSECIAAGPWDELFITNHGNGALRRDEGGEWVSVATGIPLNYFYTDMAVTSAGYIFLATDGGGLFRTSSMVSSVDDNATSRITGASLDGVRPNPITSAGLLRFSVATPGPVRITLHDMLGRELRVIADGRVEAGEHEARFDAAGLPGGVYHCRMNVAGTTISRAVVVAR
jgi:photosystem II stability/assembly factor-like uncharacterized protein